MSSYSTRAESKLHAERKADVARRPAKDRPAQRRCLGCRATFLSVSCGNRLCRNCVRVQG